MGDIEEKFSTKTAKPISESKRLRNVLYLYWVQEKTANNIQQDFEFYYRDIMEEIIDSYKAKLNG